MPHLICYDISGNSLRTKMGQKIIDSGLDRINKSVYLGTISESSLTTLENLLKKLFSQKSDPQDSLIILPLTVQQVQGIRVYGNNDLVDKDELSGMKSTLLIQGDEEEEE